MIEDLYNLQKSIEDFKRELKKVLEPIFIKIINFILCLIEK